MEYEDRQSLQHLSHDVRQAWNENADYCDDKMGEGNDFHKLLIEPAQLKLLGIIPGTTVLDVACGNGQFARKMADLGASVMAVDVSEQMIANARRRSADYHGRIEYRIMDCIDSEQLQTLGERQFDHVTCTMALMDICEITPLVVAVAKLLKTGGDLVFSVLHPCFNSGLAKQGMERHDIEGELIEEHFVRIPNFTESVMTKGRAMVGQPVPHFYFHRSLSTLFQTFFAEGFVLDALEEPVFGSNADPGNFFKMVFQKIPPALVARLRLTR